MLVRLQKLESGILRPGGDKLGLGGDWVEMRGWFCGLWRGNGAPTSGNIESVASSWASSAASVLHRPSSQTCNTSGRTWNAENPRERPRCKGRQKQKEKHRGRKGERGKETEEEENHVLVLQRPNPLTTHPAAGGDEPLHNTG